MLASIVCPSIHQGRVLDLIGQINIAFQIGIGCTVSTVSLD